MKETAKHNERIAKMTFASVYPHYVAKIEKKGRTIEELFALFQWLTGYNKAQIHDLIEKKVTLETFFEQATLNPNAALIKGKICNYTIEEIENPLTKKVRYLDKIIDELAKGKAMDKIIRG